MFKSVIGKITTIAVGAGILLSGAAISTNHNTNTVNAATTAQGPAIHTNKYVTISKKKMTFWGSFDFSKSLHSSTNWYNHTFQVKNMYHHTNGATYYSIYQGKKWFGYLNASATKTSKSAQGPAIKTNKYVSVAKSGYGFWSSFGFSKKVHYTSNYNHRTLLVKNTYYHSNGSTYYSVYRNGNWYGYLTSAAVKSAKAAQGNAVSTNKYVSITKKGYTIWGDFNWKSKKHYTSNYYHKTFQVKTIYYHYNGSTYYSLYQNGKWFGYLSSGATTAATKPSSTPTKTTTTHNNSTTVYITESGTKYHFNQKCSGLSHAKKLIKTTLGKAKAQGLTQCSLE